MATINTKQINNRNESINTRSHRNKWNIDELFSKNQDEDKYDKNRVAHF